MRNEKEWQGSRQREGRRARESDHCLDMEDGGKGPGSEKERTMLSSRVDFWPSLDWNSYPSPNSTNVFPVALNSTTAPILTSLYPNRALYLTPISLSPSLFCTYTTTTTPITAHQTAKENFQRVKLQRKARFDGMIQEGEKAALATGHLMQGFIYGKMAVQEEETRREQAHRVLLHQEAR